MDDATQEIAVLLALAPLLADLVQDILERDAEIRVVRRLDGFGLDLDATISAASASDAQVVVLGPNTSVDPQSAVALFDRLPRLKIVSIDADGRVGTTCELTPRLTPLGEPSPEELVAAVRAVAASTWEEAWAT